MSIIKNAVIAVVDDDVDIGNMIEEVLTAEGYTVLRAYSGTEARMLFQNQRPDLVLLDLMLPGLSGEELLAEITGIPVIVVSARVEVEDRVKVLLNGASDYLTKPFDIQELLARITVQLRNSGSDGHMDCVLDFELDELLHEVRGRLGHARLTRTEYAILRLLLQKPDQIITRSVLLDRICEDTPDCTESSLKVHISNLRKKLRDVSGKEYIEAVWGIGFKLVKS